MILLQNLLEEKHNLLLSHLCHVFQHRRFKTGPCTEEILNMLYTGTDTISNCSLGLCYFFYFYRCTLIIDKNLLDQRSATCSFGTQ